MARWNERQHQILKLLSVIQVATVDQIARFLGIVPQGARYHLGRLQERRGWVKRIALKDHPDGWALSEVGVREATKRFGRRVRHFASSRLARHALQVTEILIRVLEECLPDSCLTGVVCYQTEKRLFTDLVCDALLVVRLSQHRRTASALVDLLWTEWKIPVCQSDQRDVWFALEVDRGTEMLDCLGEKAWRYRSYNGGDGWSDWAEGYLRPLIVTNSPGRAGNIKRVWSSPPNHMRWAVTCWDWLGGGFLKGQCLRSEYDRRTQRTKKSWQKHALERAIRPGQPTPNRHRGVVPLEGLSGCTGSRSLMIARMFKLLV